MRQAAGDHGVGELLPRRDADALVVEDRRPCRARRRTIRRSPDYRPRRRRWRRRARARSTPRNAECRAGNWWCRRADRRSSGGSCRCRRARRLLRRGSRNPAAPWRAPRAAISSARRSAAVTKLRGPLSDTCKCSTSPRSRLRLRPARCAALIMTLRTAECCMACLVTLMGAASSFAPSRPATAGRGDRALRGGRGAGLNVPPATTTEAASTRPPPPSCAWSPSPAIAGADACSPFSRCAFASELCFTP